MSLKNLPKILDAMDIARASLKPQDGNPTIYLNGTMAWYNKGNLHRINGPAICCANHYEEWWICGKQYSEEEHKRLVKMINFL